MAATGFMKARTKDTAAEVRKIADELGLSYQTNRPDLPGSPDLVFPNSKTAMFAHGCWWHFHSCQPEPTDEYWQKKRIRNIARDTRNQADLKNLGWNVVVVWECQSEEEVAVELLAAVS